MTKKVKPANELGFSALLSQAVDTFPEVRDAIRQAASVKVTEDYDSILEYFRLKKIIEKFIGWDSPLEELRTEYHYKAVLDVIIALLPPDKNDGVGQNLFLIGKGLTAKAAQP